MSNYDGIDRLSYLDQEQLDQEHRDRERRYAENARRPAGTDYVPGCWGCTGTQRCSGTCAKPPACVFCGGPNDNQSGPCERCVVVAQRGSEWDEGAA